MSAARVLDRIVGAVRGIYGDGSDEQSRWGRVGDVLPAALADPELRAAAGGWPTSHDRANRRYTNLLFYEDPDFGFVVNGLVKDETGRTPIHDHGHAWVAYGLLEGTETILRYRGPVGSELADGENPALEPDGRFTLAAGQVDLVPPWTFHAEQAETKRTVAVMVRSARVGRFATGVSIPTPAASTTTPAPTRSPTRCKWALHQPPC